MSVSHDVNFEIRPLQFSWINEDEGAIDLCAHGSVYLRIGNEILSDEKDGLWAVSAVAMNLLATLKPGYAKLEIENFIVPCCAIPVYGQNKLSFLDCNQGIYWEIKHQGDKVHHLTASGQEVVIDIEDYRKMVWAFSDAVEQFYRDSVPKDLSDINDAEAYNALWEIWHELRHS